MPHWQLAPVNPPLFFRACELPWKTHNQLLNVKGKTITLGSDSKNVNWIIEHRTQIKFGLVFKAQILITSLDIEVPVLTLHNYYTSLSNYVHYYICLEINNIAYYLFTSFQNNQWRRLGTPPADARVWQTVHLKKNFISYYTSLY